MKAHHFDYDGEMRDIRINFCAARGAGYSYIPTVWLYKNGEKVVKILSRRTNHTTEDHAMSFKEMFSAIPFIRADQILFCADAHFDVLGNIGNLSQDEQNDIVRRRMNSAKDNDMSAQYSIVAQRYGQSYVSVDPYMQSDDDRLWWLNFPTLPIQAQHGASTLVENDKLLTWMNKMYAVDLAELKLPFGSNVFLDTLETIGHHISIKSTFHLD